MKKNIRAAFSRPFVKGQSAELDQKRSRLIARVFIIAIFLLQIAQRLYFLYGENGLSTKSTMLYGLTIPFIICLIIIIIVEHIVYRKIGARSLQYTRLVDFLLFIFFTGEWLLSLFATFNNCGTSDEEGCFTDLSALELTGFGWRCLLQGFIVRLWYGKLVAPLSAQIIVMLYAANHSPDLSSSIFFEGFSQVVFLIFIFYLENKVNFNLMLTNMQQQKWVKINEFILNNLPENIVILDIEGEVRYTSDHFKRFSRRCHCNNDPHKLFREIKNLNRHFEVDSFNLPLSTFRTKKSFSVYKNTITEYENNLETVASLHEALQNFRSLISSEGIQEKSFVMFSAEFAKNEEDEKSVEIKMSFIQQSSKQYIILILRDTTQRDRLVTAESTNKYKDRLLASVSHELRTPLNGNINLVEAAIHSEEVPENIKESLLKPALKSSKFLLHLINDILDQSQIQAQKLRLIFRMGNLKQTIWNSVQLLDLQAKKKGVRLEVKLDSQLPANFCTDHVRLSQIILNLVNNSVKFTQQGFVRVSANATETPNLIEISVEDTGIGMTKDDIDRLFGVFTHIENKDQASINPTGVGLGLNISYNLAELLGPKDNSGILVNSVIDKGSVFSFIIEDKEYVIRQPRESLLSTPNEDSSSVPDELYIEETMDLKSISPMSMKSVIKHTMPTSATKIPSSRKFSVSKGICTCAKVLVVDDDLFNILAFESILNSLKVKFESVYNGKDAIDRMLSRSKGCVHGCTSYSLVFLDQEMPGMSGTETIKEIRNLQRKNMLPKTKIVGCTAHQNEYEVDKFLKAGINHCIPKPISKEIIKTLLVKHIDFVEKRRKNTDY